MNTGQRTVAGMLAVVAVMIGSGCGGAQTPPVPGDIECLTTAYGEAMRNIQMKFIPKELKRFDPPGLFSLEEIVSPEEMRKLKEEMRKRKEEWMKFNTRFKSGWDKDTVRDSVTFLGGENANLPEPEFGGGVKPMGRYRVESWYELDGNRRDFVAVVELAYAEFFVHGNSAWAFAPQLVSLELGEEPQP